MVDSTLVLNGQTIAYTLYAIAMLLVMAWVGYQLTRGSEKSFVKPGVFYAFVGFSVVLGVSLHIITHETIPWKPIDLNRDQYTANKTFNINIRDHAFQLPSAVLTIDKGDLVLFNVSSDDLTYGFGLFRQDNSMLFQMQVLPGHKNDILWQFEKPEVLSIRSTEYSGPKGYNMYLKDVVVVK
jgi:cytochrome c oxidase subunit 2